MSISNIKTIKKKYFHFHIRLACCLKRICLVCFYCLKNEFNSITVSIHGSSKIWVDAVFLAIGFLLVVCNVCWSQWVFVDNEEWKIWSWLYRSLRNSERSVLNAKEIILQRNEFHAKYLPTFYILLSYGWHPTDDVARYVLYNDFFEAVLHVI